MLRDFAIAVVLTACIAVALLASGTALGSLAQVYLTF
jgi:hypothetical protein